jgi:hypothetical protein
VVLVLIVAGFVRLSLAPSLTLPPGGPDLVVPAPAAAGPLTRDYAAETGPYKAVVQELKQEAEKAHALESEMATIEVAIYRQPGHLDPATDGPAVLFYVGTQFKPNTPGSLSDFMAGFTNGLSSAAVMRPVSPGQVGGLAECGNSTGVATYCVWAAGQSAGMLVAPGRDYTSAQLAALMRTARPAFQKTSDSHS